MITGNVSSEEEDDEYYFGYSEPKIGECSISLIHSKEIRKELNSALEYSKKVTAFHAAVEQGDFETMQNLISSGISVDCCEPLDWTPLMKACSLGRYHVVLFLLDHGSNPNLNKELVTPLMACCKYSPADEVAKLNCVRLLLNRGVEVNATDKFKATALMYAVENGYKRIISDLLDVYDIEINLQDKEKWSAIFYAVNLGDENVVRKLIACGASLQLRDRHNRTPLKFAMDKGALNIVDILGSKEDDGYFKKSYERSLCDRYLNELPLLNGEKGFYADAKNILRLFNQHDVEIPSLPELLNMGEKELFDIGVKIKYDRSQILNNGIHRYHLRPWKKTSLYTITPGETVDLENIIPIVGDIAKHLTIINASLKYLEKRVTTRTTITSSPDMNIDNKFLNVLVNTHEVVLNMRRMLRRIYKLTDLVEPAWTSDFISSKKKKKEQKQSFFQRYFWYCMYAFSSGYLLKYYFKF